ncbi:hypothetical protein ACH5A3_16975 [Streptomyces echinatus]|uniref:hypothetical protein n=1 Tax=Streptomyces echinatus TaxID=67293 RepID=UPI0037AFEB76
MTRRPVRAVDTGTAPVVAGHEEPYVGRFLDRGNHTGAPGSVGRSPGVISALAAVAPLL